jgi:hypothetical protein
MDEGYLYCLSNISLTNILRIGSTKLLPNIKLNEINNLHTFNISTPYKIEIVKKVFNPKQKELTLYKILNKYTERTNHIDEYFNISLEDVQMFFDLIDGEVWKDIIKSNQENKHNTVKLLRFVENSCVNLSDMQQSSQCSNNVYWYGYND